MKFFLDADNSGHWYVVPVSRRIEWETWSQLDEDDEASWDVPDYARRVNGAINGVEFENPEFMGCS